MVSHVEKKATEHQSRADIEIESIKREEDKMLSTSPGLMRLAEQEGEMCY